VAEDKKGFGDGAQIEDPPLPEHPGECPIPDLAGILDEPLEDTPRHSPGSCQDNELIAPLQLMVAQSGRVYIRRALHRCEGSVRRTAQLLGISRNTLWDKMKRLEISA
jgi:DNA-binding NtrC family response regulator